MSYTRSMLSLTRIGQRNGKLEKYMNIARPMPFGASTRTYRSAPVEDPPVSGTTLLCVGLIVVIFSRIPELLSLFLQFNVRIVFVIAGFCLVGLLLQGGLASGLRSTQGILLVVFTIWMMLSGVFGVWRSGSLDLFVTIWSKSLMIFFLISGSIQTRKDLSWMMGGLSLATFFIMMQSIILGTDDSTRAAVSVGGGAGLSFGNANGLAMGLGIGIPYLLFQASVAKSFLIRVFCLLITMFSMFTIVRTGSRGGVLCLLLIILLVFLRVSILQKFAMLLGLIVMASVGIAFVPRAAIERFRIVDRLETGEARSAEASRLQRMQLLMDSISMTLKNPILGVGPGNFVTAAAKSEKERGVRETWLESHNAYTRVSSETGIPGFFMWSGILFISLFQVRALSKKAAASGDDFLANASFYSFVSLSGYSVLCLFDSNSFQFQLPMLSGVAVAIFSLSGRSLLNNNLLPPSVPGGRSGPKDKFSRNRSLVVSSGTRPRLENLPVPQLQGRSPKR